MRYICVSIMQELNSLVIDARAVVKIFFSCQLIGKKILTCRHIIRLEILVQIPSVASKYYRKVSLPCPLGEMIEMTDSLTFIAQRKSRELLQTWKCRAHCDHSIKDGLQNAAIVVSLEKFNMISLFLRYFRVPFDWNKLSVYVVKYFLCRHQHDFLMSMTC